MCSWQERGNMRLLVEIVAQQRFLLIRLINDKGQKKKTVIAPQTHLLIFLVR